MNTYLYADLDQIVFEGRPQDYGAYVMRKRYNQLLMRATLITFLLFLSITVFPKLVDWISPDVAGTEIDESVTIFDGDFLPPPPPLEKDIPEVAPPIPPTPPKVKVVAFLTPTPTPDDLVDESETIAAFDSLENVVIGLVDQDGDDASDYNYDFTGIGDGPGDGDLVLVEDKKKELGPDEFILLEKEPAPVNMDELKKLIGYPQMAKEAEIQGKVTLRILVDKFGNYKKHIVLKSPHPLLTNAVSKHISMLKVTPGIQAGSPISVWLTVPFNFTLQ